MREKNKEKKNKTYYIDNRCPKKKTKKKNNSVLIFALKQQSMEWVAEFSG